MSRQKSKVLVSVRRLGCGILVVAHQPRTIEAVTTPPMPSGNSNSNNGFNGAQITGIIIGIVAVLVALATLFLKYWYKRNKSNPSPAREPDTAPSDDTTDPGSGSGTTNIFIGTIHNNNTVVNEFFRPQNSNTQTAAEASNRPSIEELDEEEGTGAGLAAPPAATIRQGSATSSTRRMLPDTSE